MASGQFCLKWNNFHNSIVTAFESLQSSEELVDVTLMCEGRNVKAHKVILSACSPYFRKLFKETPCKHPIIILKDVLHCDLLAILQFMYQGEVLVDQDGLASFLKTAELLQVSGLAGTSSGKAGILETETPIIPTKPTVPVVPTEVTTPTRVKSPNCNSPKPSIVKVRNDIISVESLIEKENILQDDDDDDDSQSRFKPDEEPMQSCSYQTENVIIKTESADDSEYGDMEYLEPLDDPGPTNEEQSILERSLKAQGMSPHSTKLYAMDYPTQSTLTPSDIMKTPCVTPLVLKNNVESATVDCGAGGVKRKPKVVSETAPPNKKVLLVKPILPKVETKTVKCEPPQSTIKVDHHGAQIGNCPHCAKMYSNQSALKYHVRLVHSDMLNMFCCHLCPESFEYRETYKSHMWDKHNVRN